jgi:hypothetical protein
MFLSGQPLNSSLSDMVVPVVMVVMDSWPGDATTQIYIVQPEYQRIGVDARRIQMKNILFTKNVGFGFLFYPPQITFLLQYV